MKTHESRRGFVRSLAEIGTGLVGGHLAGLPAFRPLSADETQISPESVRFHSESEALVRLIEDTPRARLLEEIGTRVRQGLSYREVLAALFLAGIRNVQPRPAVGFKFHAVLVVNSAHLASQSGPDSDRWLPIFWALDEFKASQARDVSEGDWTMSTVREADVPPSGKVRTLFQDAMENWDEGLADVAAAGLARSVGATEVLELFARYAARDFRSIGHKAIYLANAWRTLQTIGWHHAEPVLRSLAYALLNHNGEPNPAMNDLAADRPWKDNLERAAKIRPGWLSGRTDSKATSELLQVLRTGSPDEAAEAVVEMLNAGVSPQSVFDAIHVGAGELLTRQPGIVALHSVTSTNAIRFLFDTVGDDETRKRLLLQNAAFLPLFREAMKARGSVRSTTIDALQSEAGTAAGKDALAAIFENVSRDQSRAASGVLQYLDSGRNPLELIARARRMIFLKGNNAHDYKFSSAVLEDYYHVSPDWRSRFLATSVYSLRGSEDPDNGLVGRIRSALS